MFKGRVPTVWWPVPCLGREAVSHLTVLSPFLPSAVLHCFATLYEDQLSVPASLCLSFPLEAGGSHPNSWYRSLFGGDVWGIPPSWVLIVVCLELCDWVTYWEPDSISSLQILDNNSPAFWILSQALHQDSRCLVLKAGSRIKRWFYKHYFLLCQVIT